MEMLVNHITFLLTATKTETAGEEVGSVGMMVVAFIEATTIATIAMRFERTGLERTPSVRVMDSGLARPDTVVTIRFDETDVQMTR